MDREKLAFNQVFERYKVPILIFFGSLFIALTLMQPQILINDEMITTNQLAQLNQGHQVIINEGKYGTFSNGTVENYFKVRNNVLSYSIFLPVISLPALKIIEILGSAASYFVLVFSIIILIGLAVIVDLHFPEWTVIKDFHWTPWVIIAAFFLFFLNLVHLVPMSASATHANPEVSAIVLTYTFLYAMISVLIYAIITMIDDNPWFRILGTIVCLCGSSYLIWMSCAKDHLLVAFLFIFILYTVVKFHYTKDSWYFPLSCILTGLLAWARPEVALPSLFAVIIYYWGSILPHAWKTDDKKKFFFFIISPIFTLVGATPFFINNYYVTGNPFLPTWFILPSKITASTVASASAQGMTDQAISKIRSVIIPAGPIHPDTFLGSLYGIIFNPQNGSMGLMVVSPFFLTALLLAFYGIFLKKNWLEDVDRELLVIMLLFSGAAFLAYFSQIESMNSSIGVLPDIRYLSTMYVPLNIIGLLLLKKSEVFAKKGKELIKLTIVISAVCIPILLVLLKLFYPIQINTYDLFTLYNNIMSILTYTFILIFFILLFITENNYRIKFFRCNVLAIIIIMPFLWQVGITYIMGIRFS